MTNGQVKSMKQLIIANMDNHNVAEDVLSALSKAGYNGSVIPSTSLKHSLENGEEVPMFVNLAHFESDKLENTTTLNIVADTSEIEKIMDIIREKTKGFTLCKGSMFAIPLEKFEGSF